MFSKFKILEILYNSSNKEEVGRVLETLVLQIEERSHNFKLMLKQCQQAK